METYPVVTIDAHGTPCFTGTNIPIATLFKSFAEGMSADQIINNHPALTRQMIWTALSDSQRFLEMHASRPSSLLNWEPDSPMGQAVAAGNIYKANLLRAKDMLPGWKAAAMTGISVDMLNRNAEDGRALALSVTKRGRRRFPEWQFDEQYRDLMSEVLAALDEFDSWGKYLFFTRKEPILGAKVPLDEIRSGRGEEVLRVARILNADY